MTVADDQSTPFSANASFSKHVRNTFSDGLQSNIGRRFAFATIACSSLLAMVMTIIQLTVDFRTDRHQQIEALTKIENSILPGLAESLWILDEFLIESQLLGIARIQGVNSVEIIGAHKEFRIENEAELTSHRVELPIIREAGGVTAELGTLVVTSNHAHIWNRLIGRAALVMITNFLKTICVACVILFLFQQLIGRHLLRVVNFANAYDPQETGQRLDLDTAGLFGTREQGCEFHTLRTAINRWSNATETHLDQLRQANQEQAEFSYAISHDLKAPTNTMAMLISELEEEVELVGDSKVIVEDMRSTNTRMSRLVVDVLDYSGLVNQQARRETVAIMPLIAEIEKDLSADIAAANATITYRDLPALSGHPTQLRMLFQNLIANAIKFRRPDQDAHVEITATVQPDTILFQVSDNGIGIPKEHRDRVFALFATLHSRSDYEGSGIGLALTRRVMSNHGGSISIDDRAEGGTTFTLNFPRNDNG